MYSNDFCTMVAIVLAVIAVGYAFAGAITACEKKMVTGLCFAIGVFPVLVLYLALNNRVRICLPDAMVGQVERVSLTLVILAFFGAAVMTLPFALPASQHEVFYKGDYLEKHFRKFASKYLVTAACVLAVVFASAHLLSCDPGP